MADVNTRLLLDVKQSVKSLDTFQKKTNSSLNSVKNSFKGLNTLAGAFAGLLAGRQLFRAFSAITDAAARQEDAINSLNSALIASGRFSESASKGLQEYASSLQKVTRFGDETILETAALIQSLGDLDNEALKGATKATLDLATALKIDLNAAAVLVGKAAAGQISSFTRYGVVIKAGATSAETFANTLQAINDKFGGAAEREVNTYSGAVDQLSNSFGDVLEDLGFLITRNNNVISSINDLSKRFNELEKVIENLDVEDVFNGLKSSIVGVTAATVTFFTLFKAGAIAAFAKQIIVLSVSYISLSGAIGAAATALKIFRSALITTGIGAIAVGVGLLAAKLFELTEEFGSFGKAIEVLFLKVKKAVTEAIIFSIRQIGQLRTAISTIPVVGKIVDIKGDVVLLESFKKSLAETKKQIDKLNKDRIAPTFDAPDAAGGTTVQVEAKITEKSAEDIKKEVTLAIKNPIEGLFGNLEVLNGEAQVTAAKIGSGIAAVLRGAEGAQSIIGAEVSRLAEVLIPGIGAVAGQIFNVLAGGPEKVRELIRSFIQAIPTIITNVVKSIPVLIQELAKAVPKIIQGLVEALPEIVGALARAMPQVALSFSVALIAEIPTIVAEFIKAIPKSAIEGGKGIVGGIGDVLGFAEGGEVPAGFPNDRFRARLTSGENVINRDLSDNLKSFLEGQSDPGRQQQASSQPSTVVLQVGEQQLASVLLNMNRNGFRTA